MDAALGLGEERVDGADGQGSDDGAPEAGRAADHEHRQREEGEVQIDGLGIYGKQVDVEAAREPGQRARQHERDQPLAIHGHPNRARRRGVFARRAQQPAEPAASVCERDHHGERCPERGLQEPCRLRDRGERVQTRPDLFPVAQDVVRDLEDAERRDPCSQAGEAHQRQADDERVRGTDGGGGRE